MIEILIGGALVIAAIVLWKKYGQKAKDKAIEVIDKV